MRILIFFLLIAICPACDKDDLPINEPLSLSYSYLALGDSYTIGQSVTVEERWSLQLINKLDSAGIKNDSLKIIAQTGWTTAQLQNAINQQSLTNFNLVSLLIGVNNQFQGLPFSQFEIEFDSLLQQAITFAGNSNRVFVVSIPDYGVTPFGANNQEQIAMELDMCNEHMSNVSANYNIPFIDITSISRSLENVSGALAADNLHPSGYQYGLWVDEIFPVVLELFQH